VGDLTSSAGSRAARTQMATASVRDVATKWAQAPTAVRHSSPLSGFSPEHPVAGEKLCVWHQAFQPPNEVTHVRRIRDRTEIRQADQRRITCVDLEGFTEATPVKGCTMALSPCFSRS
jgi:hypothetical protein